MENMSKLSKRRAVSPVIATVILVAVTITVAVAVAYWMAGISSQYTSFEKVEIQSAIFTPATSAYWEIKITLKNSGTKTATLTDIYVNDMIATLMASDTYASGNEISAYLADDGDPTTPAAIPLQIESGATNFVWVWIDDVTGDAILLSSGTTINIKIHSAAGMDYIKLVQLP